jgi:hypothetical protein
MAQPIAANTKWHYAHEVHRQVLARSMKCAEARQSEARQGKAKQDMLITTLILSGHLQMQTCDKRNTASAPGTQALALAYVVIVPLEQRRAVAVPTVAHCFADFQL